MNTVNQSNHISGGEVSLAQSAVIAGLSLFVMVASVPFAEFNIFPKLIGDEPIDTARAIVNQRELFTTAVFLHLLTLLCDVIVAWALYIFLRPVHKDYSKLASWFRIVYVMVYFIALINLIKVLSISGHPKILESELLVENVTFYISSFKIEWELGLLVFGIHLCLLGYVVYLSKYIPKIFGILLFVAGIGYVTHTLGTFFMPDVNLEFLFITFFGELFFMGWLLIKGSRIKKL